MATGERLESAVDVVILTWNDEAHLNQAIASVRSSHGVCCRVVVVDNGSTPPVELPGPDCVLVRNEQNRGVAAGRNQGAALARSPYLCFLDSDAVLERDCLAHLMDVLASHPEVGLAAPVFTGQAPRASAGRAPGLSRKAIRLVGASNLYAPFSNGKGPWWDVEFAIGACQLVRRAAFEQAGGLDESYFYGPEDVDFCLRLRDARWRIAQVRDARCHHPARRRFRNPLTRRGADHATAVIRHLWRRRRR